MKTSRLLMRVAILFIAVLLFNSCKKENTTSYDFYVASDVALTLEQAYINNFISSAAVSYPELDNLKTNVKTGVKVYSLTYKTVVGSENIDASGLVCLPSAEGEYPVICFLNGTNTVNAYCPSNFAINTQFQMIELLASMGYIVIIPDYPGFGSSYGIPHPYLVAEPTVRSTTDMFYAVKEFTEKITTGIIVKNRYYIMGYSQGGWAAMTLHKALETEYQQDFSLAGSVCGAGPYDMRYLFDNVIGQQTYPMPVYLCYIIHAYSEYAQFTNPVTDIINSQYATKLGALYDGTNDFSEINAALTTTVAELFTPSFISGYQNDAKYQPIREALLNNSIAPYHSYKPLLFVHGGSDTQVNPVVTEYFYGKMLEAGTSDQICKKMIFPGLDHGDGAVPGLIEGVKFILGLEDVK